MLLLTIDIDDGSCGWDVVANGGKKCQKKISTENGFACVEKRRHQTGLLKKRLRLWWWMKDNLAAGPSCPESRTSHESRTWEGGSQRSRVIIAGGGGWLLLLLMPTAPHLETILGLVLKTFVFLTSSSRRRRAWPGCCLDTRCCWLSLRRPCWWRSPCQRTRSPPAPRWPWWTGSQAPHLRRSWTWMQSAWKKMASITFLIWFFSTVLYQVFVWRCD